MKRLIHLLILFISLLFFTKCKETTDQTTTLEVVDNNRHYYPVLQGQQKTMIFQLINRGNHPFILSDILVSCGCLVVQKAVIQRIPAGEVGELVVQFDTTKNVGDVKHYITLYGNLSDRENIEVTFDLQVVPDSHYTKDYEELFQAFKGDKMKDWVDGTINKEYEVDEK